MNVLLFVAGAGIGAPLRYIVDRNIRARTKSSIGILLVNVIGSFLIGVTQSNYFLMGFCGAFTTWSAFALEVSGQDRRDAITNIVMTFALCVGAVLLGKYLAS